MRKLALPLAVALLVPLAALAAGGALQLDTATRLELTDCASGGATTGSTPATPGNSTSYLMRVTDADVFLCYDVGTCAAGGEKFPQGTVLLIAIPAAGKTFSCRSSGSNADVIMTRVTAN